MVVIHVISVCDSTFQVRDAELFLGPSRSCTEVSSTWLVPDKKISTSSRIEKSERNALLSLRPTAPCSRHCLCCLSREALRQLRLQLSLSLYLFRSFSRLCCEVATIFRWRGRNKHSRLSLLSFRLQSLCLHSVFSRFAVEHKKNTIRTNKFYILSLHNAITIQITKSVTPDFT